MSQGKKDKFLPVFFGALGVATLGLGFLSYSASSDADESETAYNAKLEELKALENAPLSRTEENAAKKVELVAAYVKKVKELDATLQAYQVEEKEITSDVFQRELKKQMDDFAAAAKAKQVKIPAAFDFGMTKYLSATGADTAPKLNAQLQGLVFLSNAALEAGVIEVNSLTRQELAFEKEKPNEPKPDPKAKKTAAPKPTASKPSAKKGAKDAAPEVDESTIIERQPVSLILTGKNNSILRFLELIANTSPEKSPYFFVIRTLKLENEAKDGPPKNVDVKVEEKPDPNVKDGPPIKYDAAYVLGFEKVMVQLEVDLVRFIPDVPDENEKPDGKAANKNAAVNAADNKPSDKGEPVPN
jgi:hypothetical protein